MKTIHHTSESDSDRGVARQPEMEGRDGWAHTPDAHLQLARLADAQDVPVVKDVSDLRVDFWPQDESADDVNAYVYRQRRQDRMIA